jgi:hypothetical protein
MQSLVAEKQNPYYEVLMPFGACAAARMNAELGRNYDVEKLVNWCFAGDSSSRGPWGAVIGRWGDYDVSGLIGDVNRVFLMNTFDTAGPLVSLVRYDPRFARAVGKWMLNAANAARLFYPEEIPDEYQSCPEKKAIVRNVIGYEAISPNRFGKPLFADRDDWGPETREPKASQFTLYGSSHVGVFGAIIGQTSDEKILQLNCLATDFFIDKAYPTCLYYNPYGQEREVTIDVGAKAVDVYDAASHAFLQRNVQGRTTLPLPKDGARVIVLTPASGQVTREGRKLLVNGTVVDYQLPTDRDN